MKKFKKLKVPKIPERPALDVPTLQWLRAVYAAEAVACRNYEKDDARHGRYDQAFAMQQMAEAHEGVVSDIIDYIYVVKCEAKEAKEAKLAKAAKPRRRK
jgi:hypothetical protein